jgi:hypothetical protein
LHEIGRLFREIGRPVPDNRSPSPPAPEVVQYFLITAEKYGYWAVIAEESGEIGLKMPGLPAPGDN